MSKIDRVLGNDLWDEAFPSAVVTFLPEGLFDHSPMVVSFSAPQKGKRPFRFFNYWTTKDDFLDRVRSVWNLHFEGHLSYQIS